ncbi:hypothetical protein VMCG_07790 [Cytospora schulzeri]|uniref:Uncharacterized protein n=1 Tax=Cytospora schulzeri TaxID=448051 RepID=A0A423VZQ8_9PEZI|nr:hypothetical protein VMCG_07790 [Valsa malicola]
MSRQTDGGLLGALGDGVSGLLGDDQDYPSSTPLAQTSSSPEATDSIISSTSVNTQTLTTSSRTLITTTSAAPPSTSSAILLTDSRTTSLLESVSSTVSSTGTTASPLSTTATETSSSLSGSVSQGQTLETGTLVPTTLISSTLNIISMASSTEATPSSTASLHNESEQGIHKASGISITTTTAIAIAAPIGGVGLIGFLMVMYKTRGWMRRKIGRRGMRLDNDDIQSLREVQQHEKFNPARDY